MFRPKAARAAGIVTLILGPAVGLLRRVGFSIRYTATIVVIIEICGFSNRYTTP
jgi:hypothetical protein